LIEPLEMENEFEIITKSGTWRMSKSDFYREFDNVRCSESY
jgi:hypothetical protein